MKHSIFVYGTLRHGGAHYHRLNGAPCIANAYVKGVLYHIDWYPAIVLTNEGSNVRGELYLIDDITLAELDLFEGDEYQRILVNAEDDQGNQHQAWIWAAWQTPQKPIILSGDWLHQ